MINDVLQSITHVEIYPIFALVIMMAVFVLLVMKAIMMDKTRIAYMSRMPLEDKVGDVSASDGTKSNSSGNTGV